MFAPDYDDLTIESEPSGAEVYIGADHIGTTPFTYRFDRVTFESPEITIRKEGYKSQTVRLERTFDNYALLNLGFILTTSGVTSFGIDAASGNMTKYAPNSYLIDLQKTGGESSASWRRHHSVIAFVLTNHMNLMKDISKGGGEYTKAYYDLKVAQGSRVTYPEFLENVQRQSESLVSCKSEMELYRALDNIIATPDPAKAQTTNSLSEITLRLSPSDEGWF
jgi:hypothetical protein